MSFLIKVFAESIGMQVLDYLQKHRALQQFERMQGEILEGWLYKLKIGIQEVHQRNNVNHSIHKEVIKNECNCKRRI